MQSNPASIGISMNLISEMGLDKLPEKDRERAILAIGDIIFQGVMARVIEMLSPADREELDAFLADPAHAESPSDLHDFILRKVPNLDQLVAEEIDRFKGDALQMMQEIG